MSLAVAGRKRQTVQTARRLAECSRKWRLLQGMSDGRLLTGGTAGRAAAAWTTTADGDDLAGLIPERVDSEMVAPYRSTLRLWCMTQQRVVITGAEIGMRGLIWKYCNKLAFLSVFGLQLSNFGIKWVILCTQSNRPYCRNTVWQK